MYSVGLLIACLIAGFWGKKAACIFAATLCCAIVVSLSGLPYTKVWFFATYAGIGAIVFLLFDWKAGVLLCLVSIPGSLYVLGYIDKIGRDMVGEGAFLAGLLAAIIFGPSGGVSNSSFFFNRSGRNSAVYGHTDGVQVD